MMRAIVTPFRFLVATASVLAADTSGGCVLKPREGEDAPGDKSLAIEASPRAGSRGMVAVEDVMPASAISGIHAHVNSNQAFYVVRGYGRILIGDREHDLAPWDFAFVPAGVDHRVTSSQDDPIIMYEIVDRPGLDEVFRQGATETTSLEARNALSAGLGTMYKTLARADLASRLSQHSCPFSGHDAWRGSLAAAAAWVAD